MSTINFREGVAHAQSVFQDLPRIALATNYPEMLANLEELARVRGGEFGEGVMSFVDSVRNVLSKKNAVASPEALR